MDVTEELAALVDQVIDLGDTRFTRLEVAAKAEVDLEFASRFWRASGFPEVGDDVRMFGDADIRMLRGVRDLLKGGVVDIDTALEISRTIGQTSSRLAAAEISVLRERISKPVTDEGTVDQEAATEAAEFAGATLPFLEASLVYLWRRHLSANAKRVLVSAGGDQPVRCVGFVDMTGFSTQTQTMEADDLERVINRFEAVAFDVVASFGGRVVKLIGDEVMFVADGPTSGAQIALELVEQLEEDPELPRVRGGLAFGAVVEIQGDVFGETVNLASRLTNVAKPGTIIVSQRFKDSLDDANDLQLRRIRSITTLKGVGKVKAYVLRAAPQNVDDDRATG